MPDPSSAGAQQQHGGPGGRQVHVSAAAGHLAEQVVVTKVAGMTLLRRTVELMVGVRLLEDPPIVKLLQHAGYVLATGDMPAAGRVSVTGCSRP